MEIENQVIVFQVDNECSCGGLMRPIGNCLTMNPPLYPHKCNKCGNIEYYNNIYPYIKYENKLDVSSKED